MKKFILFICLILCSGGFCLKGGNIDHGVTSDPGSFYRDTTDKQLMLNGRIWRNLFYNVRGDQFLFTDSFLPGTLVINGKTWDNCSLRYDIYNDEIQTMSGNGIIVQLNKEMISAFSIKRDNKIYNFIKLEKDTLNPNEGYFNVLYSGSVSLLIKYQKRVLSLAVDGKYDAFEQTKRIYMVKGGRMFTISNRHSIIQLFGEYKQQIKSFLRSNKIDLSKESPDSYIPVAEFCDKLGR